MNGRGEARRRRGRGSLHLRRDGGSSRRRMASQKFTVPISIKERSDALIKFWYGQRSEH